ncbi:MAG: UbiA family prenyltransferase [Pseudomonadota bacterium]
MGADTGDGAATRPLVFDLDGTLIRADTTFELCVQHVKAYPLTGAVQLFRWFLASKESAKTELARRHGTAVDPEHLPWSDLTGHEIFRAAPVRALVSGSADPVVQRIGEHLGGFAHVRGTGDGVNMIGPDKARHLTETYPDGFDYVGDSRADIPVWHAAGRAYAANASRGTIEAARAEGIDLEVISQQPGAMRAILKGMRLHQWAKNGLIAVVPLLNLAIFQPVWAIELLLGFIAFGLVASATYLFNDLLDIPADRAHRTKRARPFAAGDLPIPKGCQAIAGLGGAGFVLALLLDPGFAAMLVLYTAVSLAYSFQLKRIMALDVIVLAFLFCLRVLAGAVLVGLETNMWFMLSLGFFFFGLALGKRAIELAGKQATASIGPGENVLIRGRGYVARDLSVVMGAGLASSFVTVLIVAIYALLSRSAVIEHEAAGAAIVAILTFWQTRFWLLVGRDEVHDDPIIFALKDRLSALTLALLGVVVVFEQLWPRA